MKNYILILTIALLASCTSSDEQQKKDTDNALKVATEVSTNEPDTTSYYRATGDKNQDSALLQLVIRNNIVSGTLQYMPYEKDARRGTLAGEKKGDIINAVWTYTQEGMEDTMSVSFKFRKGTVYQKPNVFKPKLGREVLDQRADYEIEYKKTEFK